jgi:GDP/UDP-N,N'-diacetylbacillosamine 2-epimerase (hydrolysing)
VLKKKILMITERRADYSKLRPIIKEIKKSKKLDYQLIVTGSHILSKYGNTIDDIKRDNFKISSILPMFKKISPDTGSEMVRAYGRIAIKLADEFERLKPDIVLSGFDIGANFMGSILGSHMNILVAHIEGGEVTGTIDESIRHAMTKFSHIHFTSNTIATDRIVKMGENKKYVFTVGNTSLDGILSVKTILKHKLCDKYGLDIEKPFILILQHTVTSEIDQIDKNFSKTLDAVTELDLQAIIIFGNSDAGSNKIMNLIKNSKIKQFRTVPYGDYINLLRYSSALVGNSSSGIIEAPFLKIPSVNIGTRQSGRTRSNSILDVGYDKSQITKAILKSLTDEKFLKKIKDTKNLYGDGNAAKKIVKILEDIDLNKIPIQKRLMY